jgi:hypothetical protein
MMNSIKTPPILINKEIIDLLENGFIDSAFLIAVMGIEFLGAVADDKPLRANGQSSKRFKIGLRKFFPKRYGKPSITEHIYKGLRCNAGHLLHFSSKIEFVEDPTLHLKEDGIILKIHKREFVEDYIKAAEKLSNRILEGLIQLKKGI